MSNKINHLLNAIKKAQAEHSHASLVRPAGRDAFEYGRAVGFYQGLCQVEIFINDILKEDETHVSSQRR